MTSSGASDRTSPPSAPSRPVAGSAPNLLKRFFVMCSGATPELLYAPSYLTELNKYAMLGALICFTAGFAALSGGYAAYTAFREPAIATALGVLWGLFIFTLDRLIVAGIRKQPHEPHDTWAVWLGKSLREILQAFPRLVLAVFLALVIATPLELKLFEREIQWYLAHDTQMRAIEAEHLAQEEFSDIEDLRTRNQELFQLLRAKEKRRDTLRDQAVAELATNMATRTRLEAQKQQRLAVVKTVADNAHGLLARLNALYQLARDRDNLALGWAIFVIFFVFLAVETAPVLIKVMFRYGPYDMLLERIETEVILQESQRLRSAQARITAAAQYWSNPDLQ